MIRPLDAILTAVLTAAWSRCAFADCPVCGRIDTLGRDWGRWTR